MGAPRTSSSRGRLIAIAIAIMAASLILMGCGACLVLRGVRAHYGAVLVPTYDFEVVGPGNVTVLKTESLCGDGVRMVELSPGKRLEFEFEVESGDGCVTISGIYVAYCDSAEALTIEVHKMVNGTWARLPVEIRMEGGCKPGVEGYAYVVERKFDVNLSAHVPGRFKLAVASGSRALVRALKFEVVRTSRETVYYPYPVLRPIKGYTELRVIDRVSRGSAERRRAHRGRDVAPPRVFGAGAYVHALQARLTRTRPCHRVSSGCAAAGSPGALDAGSAPPSRARAAPLSPTVSSLGS